MLEWKPRRFLGISIGIGVIVALVLLDGLILRGLRSLPLSFTSFVMALTLALSVLLAALASYLVYGVLTLKYMMGRDGVLVLWAGRQETIPLAAIQAVVWLTEEGESITRPRLRLPGHCIGKGRDAGGREVQFYSTGRGADELLITTALHSYVISPDNPTGFLSAVRARRRLGPTRSLEQTRREGGLAGLAIWRDWKALSLVTVAIVANVSLFGYIAFRYPALPEIVPLLSESGQVRLLGAKEELFELPALGLVVLLGNTVLGFALHRWERPVTYALGAVALFVQIIAWWAAISVMG
jgi:hypothetical protein